MKPKVQLIKKGSRYTVRARVWWLFWAYYGEYTVAAISFGWPCENAWVDRITAERTFKGVSEDKKAKWEFAQAPKQIFKES